MTTEWRIDSTFKLVAPPFTQLFSIHSPLDLGGSEKQYALGFVLMSGKRKEDYQAVFEEIIKTLENERGLSVKVKSFLLDYEVSAWQALREVFGDSIKIRGCYFHLMQALIRKLHNKGLMSAYYQKGALHKFIKQLASLPLLDAPAIPGVFDHMVGKVCEAYQYSLGDYNDMDKRKEKHAPKLIQVFQYFEDQWMNGKNFTPKDWSIYWEDIRTNNSLEQWNGKVTKEAGNKGLHIFKLGKYLHNYTKSVESIDIRLHMWGVYDNYKKASQSKKDEQFKKLWRDYENELQSNTKLSSFLLLERGKPFLIN